MIRPNSKFIVIDLETFAHTDDAVIVSMGIVHGQLDESLTFDEYVKDGAYFEYKIIEQVKEFDRRIDDNVLDWWGQLPEKQQAVLNRDPALKNSVTQIGDDLYNYAEQHGVNLQYAYILDRNSYDLSKIKHVVEVINRKSTPWNYHNVLELTTALTIMTGDRYGNMDPHHVTELAESFEYHNPAHDAALDALRFQTAFANVFSGEE